MLTFAYPWLALLAPLPFLARWLLPSYAPRRPGLSAPFFNKLVRLTGERPQTGVAAARRGRAQTVVLALCWLLVLASAARPQWIEPPLHHDRPTRDLLLLVDLSGSMDAKDFVDPAGKTVDRLTAVKQVLDAFLARREGDRVGVAVFGDAPFVLVPFTTDLALCRTMLGDTVVGMAGPRTALGDAIGLGVGLFDWSTVKSKTIIALTDGNDTASKAPPIEAAGVAKDRGIVIHTVAIGDPAAVGEEKLDEGVLKDVSGATGGGFFRAMDRVQLEQIYARIDEVETRKIDAVTFRPKTDVYWIPLAFALLLSMTARAAMLAVASLSGRGLRLSTAQGR